MGKTTGIEWAQATWNPWTGCHKVSEGCKNCYMFRGMKRFGQDPNIVVRTSNASFLAPHKWKNKRVFVCSWSDFFIEEADAWREDAWQVMRGANTNTYLLLTKRPERIMQCLPWVDWEDWWRANIWIGVSAENQETFDKRAAILLEVPTVVHWFSIEPMLGPIDFHFPKRINPGRDMWFVFGGESGPNARPMYIEWLMHGIRQCREANIPVFVKQDYGRLPGKQGAIPDESWIKEFPDGQS